MIQFNYKETASIKSSELEAHANNIREEIELITSAQLDGYESEYAFLHAPDDEAMREEVIALVQHIRKNKKPTMIIVVGVGGSSWGTLALFQALQGSIRHLRVVFFDLIDDMLLQAKLGLVAQELERGGSPIMCLVSKSGSSTETIMCGSLILEVLRQYKKKFWEHVVAITDQGSQLWQLAEEEKYHRLCIPKKIGGRYSAFTPVSLFPLALTGGNINEFHQGALTIRSQLLSPEIENNMAALSALITYTHMQRGAYMSNLFVFHPLLSLLGQWHRQLVAESLGKKYDRDGTIVNRGITPLVSRATQDLHTVIQLYLGGPYDKITTFISVRHESAEVTVPSNALSALIPSLEAKSVTFVKHAILKGVQAAYKESKRPFMEIVLPQLDEYSLGQLMMAKMVETVFLAKLLNVNPFDQPAVELYKKETRKLLHEGRIPE